MEVGQGKHPTWHLERGTKHCLAARSAGPNKRRLVECKAGSPLPGRLSLSACPTKQAETLRLLTWPAFPRRSQHFEPVWIPCQQVQIFTVLSTVLEKSHPWDIAITVTLPRFYSTVCVCMTSFLLQILRDWSQQGLKTLVQQGMKSIHSACGRSGSTPAHQTPNPPHIPHMNKFQIPQTVQCFTTWIDVATRCLQDMDVVEGLDVPGLVWQEPLYRYFWVAVRAHTQWLRPRSFFNSAGCPRCCRP